jgi:hypothetical protein
MEIDFEIVKMQFLDKISYTIIWHSWLVQVKYASMCLCVCKFEDFYKKTTVGMKRWFSKESI